MDLEKYRIDQLMASLEQEVAKSLSEIRCAQGDLEKANSRLRFTLAVIHVLKNKTDKKDER